MTVTIFATNNKTKEKLVFCQTQDLEMAKDIVRTANKSLFSYEILEKEYAPTRIGLEGKDGRWV